MIDPIVELIDHEVGLLQTMHVLKMGAIMDPPPTPRHATRNTGLRTYHRHLKELVTGLEQLKDDYTGKEYRIKVHNWARILHRNGRQNITSRYGGLVYRHEGYAMKDFSKAIIDAFTKLPR